MSTIQLFDLKSQYARLKPLIAERFNAVLEHGAYINGPEVAELESQLAAFTGAKAAIAVASGTDALIIPLMALGIGPGDAVFIPAFTYNATANAVLMVGATPVFVDVDPATFNMDPEDLEDQIERTRLHGPHQARAIIPVDLFGLPADYAAIGALAQKYELAMLADAAQSFGGGLGGKRVGALAPITGTSFFPSKTLGGYGDGGAIFTQDESLVPVIQSIRWHGTDAARKESIRVGMNGRLDSLQAAVILAKLTIFEEECTRRAAIGALYDEGLKGVVPVQATPPTARNARGLYSILVPDRPAFQEKLKAAGIPTSIYYSLPLHLHAAFKACGAGEGSLPVCERLARHIVALPMHPYLADNDVTRVIEAVRSAL
jgi:dTDP-4-amino-4,6-dideoxygalactose transaminase